MKKIWVRQLIVKLKSKLNRTMMQFGHNTDDRNLIVYVNGNKYLSSLKDEFVVDIYNLTYGEIAKIIAYKYDEIEVFAGYKSTGVNKIFEGKILDVSMERESRETNVVHIICVSKLLGLYNSKLNLSLNSGVNMYAALDFILKRAGVQNSNISEEFKRQFITDTMSAKGTASSFLDVFTRNSTSFVVQADSSKGAIVSIWDMKRTDARVVNIRPENGLLIKGYPTLTSEGVRLTSLPIFNFMPGDTLVIDNRLIDTSISSVQEATQTQLGFYLDKNNQYLLVELNYNLSNADGEFEVRMKAKSKSMLMNVFGGAVR